MNTVELFCGTKSFSKIAEQMGYKTFTVDLESKRNPDLVKNILDLNANELPSNIDFLWASPPCTEYSKAKSRGVRDIDGANKIVLKTLELIKELKPKYWVIENPQTGLLKKQEFMKDIPFVDASYCKYGMPYRKQTRFWTNIPNLKLKTCHKDCNAMNGNKHIGSAGNGRAKWTNKSYSVLEKYAIPSELIKEFLKTP